MQKSTTEHSIESLILRTTRDEIPKMGSCDQIAISQQPGIPTRYLPSMGSVWKREACRIAGLKEALKLDTGIHDEFVDGVISPALIRAVTDGRKVLIAVMTQCEA